VVVEMIQITREDFSVDETIRKLRTDEMGAVATFVGVVRGESKGREVDHIEIHVYEEMAKQQLQAIEKRAIEKFGVKSITVIHRIGSLNVAENILLIAVGAGHRREAFDACRYILEQIKRMVPIWKKEYTPDGSYWVEEKHDD
jgi:molybdopterin synthase catalytic subunit